LFGCFDQEQACAFVYKMNKYIVCKKIAHTCVFVCLLVCRCLDVLLKVSSTNTSTQTPVSCARCYPLK
jgi:hypothetical protein